MVSPAGDGMATRFDLRALPDEFYANPYPTYRRLREEAPVLRLPDGGILITRHADLLSVYKDTRTFSSDKTVEFGPKFGVSPLYEHHTTSLVFSDPPRHTRVRRLMLGALTPKAIERMEAGLVTLVDALLDAAADKGTIDLVADYAAAIPIEVIGNLLDVPRDERAPLRGWSLAILGALEPKTDATLLSQGNAAVSEFTDYLRTLVARRRAQLGNPETDVLTRLIQGEDGGERLTESELLQNCIFILNAGHETTTNLIANALVALTDWPGERARLVANPLLAKTAVEEFLRFDSPVQLGNRISTTPACVGGLDIGERTVVNLCLGAANRDPAQFADPDRLDLGREPNRQLAFASGPHQCVGNTLARLEGRIAIGQFLARFPNYQLCEIPVRAKRARFRGFIRAPLFVRS